MLSNAGAVLLRLGPSARTPPKGTGPLGAMDGLRWITRDDVVAWNCETSVCQTERHTFASAINTRQYTSTANTLYDYQVEAVLACNPEEGVFCSGVVNMECGTGKTWVASELIRRSNGTCVVVAQHTVSVAQIVTHLTSTLGIHAISLQEDEVTDFSAYDVVVTTYSRVVRLVSAVDEHRARISEGSFSPSYSTSDRFLMYQLCEPFGLLILDEVHTVVADKFLCVCRLRAHAVVGFSGSLVREDDRIVSLDAVIGPTLFSYGNMQRVHTIHVHRAPAHDARVCAATSRTALHQTIRALNPPKVEALMRILAEYSETRVIVFSDTVQPTQVLHNTVLQGRSLVLNGQTSSREARNETIDTFSRSQPGSLVLLCTKVCDVSIDFPVGCVIVQYHLTSGSRQQEVQRCGRGTRGSTGAIVYHIVNQGTDEERFSERRIEHLREEMWGKVEVEYMIADAEVQPSSELPIASLMRIKITNGIARMLTKPSKNYGRLLRRHKS